MSERINDSVRFIIGCGIRALGAVFTVIHRLRMRLAVYNQHRLRHEYNVSDQTPVRPYDNELERLINSVAATRHGKFRFPITSGSTGTPKRVLFTKRRLRSLKLVFSDFYLRCCWSFSIKRTSLYVFSSLERDESLTSMLLEEAGLPSYVSTLQAPYRVQSHSSLGDLRSKYGDTAVRLWILTLSNPGVLYSTNPSTISTFFDELQSNWGLNSRLIRGWFRDCESFDPCIRRMARRISSKGASERVAAVARCVEAPILETFAPAVSTYICWTGGYVKPFLHRLEKYLPATRYRAIPMYSMSTETVETIIDIRGKSISFLPIATGVLYEFREEPSHAEDKARLLKPHQLEPAREYSLIVSDNYGLRRYDTGDVFLCRKKVGDLPDLFFQRRRNLEYSFTGEKLTADQVTAVFETLRYSHARSFSDKFLTCIPSQPAEDPVPHYKLVVIADQLRGVQFKTKLSERCDQLFAEINCEYKAKRESGRLGPVRLVTLTRSDFLKLARVSNSWETQFKFLPLYLQTWEAMRKDEG
jgi:hypothetical protein